MTFKNVIDFQKHETFTMKIKQHGKGLFIRKCLERIYRWHDFILFRLSKLSGTA